MRKLEAHKKAVSEALLDGFCGVRPLQYEEFGTLIQYFQEGGSLPEDERLIPGPRGGVWVAYPHEWGRNGQCKKCGIYL